MSVSAIVLAAGEGSRMRSSRPKPLHLLCGRPMVMHVIHSLEALQPDRTVVVVGHGAERVTKKVQEQSPDWAHVTFVEQTVQRDPSAEVLCDARVRVACIDADTFRVRRLPGRLVGEIEGESR